MENINEFIQLYDNMLIGVAEGIETIGKQVGHTDGIRVSNMSNNLIIGFFAAKVYSAMAMGEKYLERRPWEDMKERFEEDEMNFGMILHYLNSEKLAAIRDTVLPFLDKGEATEHANRAMMNAEKVLHEMTNMICGGDWLGKLPEMINDLGGVLKEIYSAEHPEYDGKGKVKAKIPRFDDYMRLCAPSMELVAQQANTLRMLEKIVDTMLRNIGTWPMTCAQMEILACDMEEAIMYLHGLGKNDFKPEVLDEIIKISEESIERSVAKMDWLVEEYRKVSPADMSRVEEAIGGTAFPLMCHSEAATAACGGMMFLFPRIMAEYKIMAQEYIAMLKEVAGR